MLTLSLLISLFASIVFAQNSGVCGLMCRWRYDPYTYELRIVGQGEMGNFNYFDVPWRHLHENVATVSIDNGIVNIGSWSFYTFTNLTSVHFGRNDTYSNSYSNNPFSNPQYRLALGNNRHRFFNRFRNDTYYDEYENREYYEYYHDNYDFYYRDYPGTLREIGNYAFFGCDKLTFIRIPIGVDKIGEMAFDNCLELNKILIPSTVTQIGESAFHITPIKSIYIPRGVTIIEKDTFLGCSNLVNVTLAGPITRIKEYAFGWCLNLTQIVLPPSLNTIDKNAFERTKKMKTLIYLGQYAPRCAQNVFFKNQVLKTVNVTQYYLPSNFCQFVVSRNAQLPRPPFGIGFQRP